MPDTIPVFSTREAARRFEIAAARGRAFDARIRKDELVGAVDDMLRALRRLEAAGVDRAYLFDTARGLHDAASNVDGVCNREIDEADLYVDPIELGELEAFMAHLDPMGT